MTALKKSSSVSTGRKPALSSKKLWKIWPIKIFYCGGEMKAIAFITGHSVIGRIINHLNLAFVADKPPPPQVGYQGSVMTVETFAEYFSSSFLYREGEITLTHGSFGTSRKFSDISH